MAQESQEKPDGKKESNANDDNKLSTKPASALSMQAAFGYSMAMIKYLRYGSENDDAKENDGGGDIDIDKIIESSMKGEVVDSGVLDKLTLKAKELMLNQGALIELECEKDNNITYVGSIAGHFDALLKIFKANGAPSDKNTYVFLGRYVDRGDKSLETLTLLLAYKIKYPKNVWLLRGNHESLAISTIYGLRDQCNTYEYKAKNFLAICDCFDCMPFAAIIDKKIFCVSSGISPDLKNLDVIKQIKLPTDIPPKGLKTDLLWSEPKEDIDSAEFEYSTRGAGRFFGEKAVLEFCKKFGFDLVIRGCLTFEQNGFNQFGKEKKLITLCTAENYCGEYDNKGAFLTVNNNGEQKFIPL